MYFEIQKIVDIKNRLAELLPNYYGLKSYHVADCIATVDNFLSYFNNDLFVGIEFPYVDKLYRSTYYNYYGSKLSEYKRDCIRLSFFTEEVTSVDFLSLDGAHKLQSLFKGFLVLRPNFPNMIGRNVLQPDILKKTANYWVKVTTIEVAINGVKLMAEGFPHSSQDFEFMVCAETTIWSVMEYFANTYVDYKSVLPHDIHKMLSNTSMQRQVPSEGLNMLQISYALKELGFGVKSYLSSSYTITEFYRLIQIYLESGIPVLATIANTTGTVHVINIVGRTDYDDPRYFRFTEIKKLDGGASIYDYYELSARVLVIDDNLVPYSVIALDNPVCNYMDPQWDGCKIYAAIVPLHKRIWMEADQAKALAIEHLTEIGKCIPLSSVILKVFLTSSRSFKHYVAINPDLDPVIKLILNLLELPKFVWIAQLSTPEFIAQKKITGLILMDATEPKKSAVLATLLENNYIGTIRGRYSCYPVPLSPFQEFVNLKLY